MHSLIRILTVMVEESGEREGAIVTIEGERRMDTMTGSILTRITGILSYKSYL